jgi:hypothetical protein
MPRRKTAKEEHPARRKLAKQRGESGINGVKNGISVIMAGVMKSIMKIIAINENVASINDGGANDQSMAII